MHELFKVQWYYDWTTLPRAITKVEFVPLIKSEGKMGDMAFIEQMTGVTHVLGFNEPEREKQGDVALERALDLWPQLVVLAEKLNLRLGSPAPSSDKLGIDWFEAFMAEAKRRKLRVDFIAMHWYRGRDATQFQQFIEGLAKDHRLPVWITEFNGWSGTEQENYAFLKGSLRFLERSSKVERYAYFNPTPGKPHSLLAADGTLTRMGELYRDA